MTNFKFDEKKIKDKINYTENLLKRNDLSQIERERVQYCLLSYYAILDSIDNTYNTAITPFLDKITKGKYSASKESNRLCKTGKIVIDKKSCYYLAINFYQLLYISIN